MSLHNVTIQAAVHEHTALHINLVAHFEQTQITTVKCFLYGSYSVGAVTRQLNHCEAHTIVRHTLVNL